MLRRATLLHPFLVFVGLLASAPGQRRRPRRNRPCGRKRRSRSPSTKAAGNPAVAVAGLAQPMSAELVGRPNRVPSPFWNQAGKMALRIDAAKKQCVRLVDVPYLDRPDAMTLSLFFLSLDTPADGNPHGILGKRSTAGGTNYGINYVPASDVFQVYVNDTRLSHRQLQPPVGSSARGVLCT